MLRKVGLTLAVLAVLVLVAAALLPYIITLERYRTRITAELERAVGRPVGMGAIRLTVLTGLGLRVEHIVVDDLPEFGEAPLAALGAAEVHVAFLPLLRGVIDVRRVVIEQPEVTIVRAEDGRLNLAALGQTEAGEPPAEKPAASPPGHGAALAGLTLRELDLRGGRVRYLDRTTATPGIQTLEAVEADLRNVALGATAEFRLGATWREAERTIEANGTIGPLTPAFDPLPFRAGFGFGRGIAAELDGRYNAGLHLTITAEALQLAELLAVARHLVPDLPPDLGGEGPVGVAAQVENTAERGAITARIDLSRARLQYAGNQIAGRITVDAAAQRRGAAPFQTTAELALENVALMPPKGSAVPPISNMTGRGVYAENMVRFERLRLRTLGGEVTLSGRYGPLGGADPRFEFRGGAAGLGAGDTLTQFTSLGNALRGQLNLELSLAGRGTAWETVSKTLSGEGAFTVAGGRLMTANLLQQALVSIGLEALAGDGARETVFDEFAGRFAIAQGRIRLRDARMTSDQYRLTAAGTIGLDGTLDLDGRLLLSAALTDRLGRAAAVLTSEGGRAVLPLEIKGTPNAPKVQVPASALRKEARKELRERARGALERFLER